METTNKALFYLFVMGVLLILVAYWVGSTNLLSSLFKGANTIDLTATGRDQNGNFAAYPVTH